MSQQLWRHECVTMIFGQHLFIWCRCFTFNMKNFAWKHFFRTFNDWHFSFHVKISILRCLYALIYWIISDIFWWFEKIFFSINSWIYYMKIEYFFVHCIVDTLLIYGDGESRLPPSLAFWYSVPFSPWLCAFRMNRIQFEVFI